MKYIGLGCSDFNGNYELDNINIIISNSKLELSNWSECTIAEQYDQKKYYMKFNDDEFHQLPDVWGTLLVHGSKIGIFISLVRGESDCAVFSSSSLSEDQLQFFNKILDEEHNGKKLCPVSE